MYKLPKSKRGAAKQYDAITRAYRRIYAGGGMLGYDWTTFRMNAPEAFEHIKAVRAIYAKLPD